MPIFFRQKGIRGGIIFLSILIFSCWSLTINGIREYYEQLISLHTANLATHILTFLGMDVQSSVNSIFYNGFSVTVGRACIAFYETIVFAAAIIAYPMKIKDKVAGILLGVVAVWATNLLRVMVLFFNRGIFSNFF